MIRVAATFSIILLTTAHARAQNQALIVTLDAPDGLSPDYVCVLAREKCTTDDECQNVQLEPIEKIALARDPQKEIYRFKPDINLDSAMHVAEERDADKKTRLLARIQVVKDVFRTIDQRLTHDTDVEKQHKLLARIQVAKDVFKALAEGAPTSVATHEPPCDDPGIGACVPELRLDQFKKQVAKTAVKDKQADIIATMTCGKQAGAGIHRPGEIPRIAFLGLTFANPLDGVSPIQQVDVFGTAATITFQNSLASPMTYVQVIGGDYVPSKTFYGTKEHIEVALQPRCSRQSVHLSSHIAEIQNVTIDGDKPLQCTPSNRTTRTPELQIPYSSSSEKKTLTVAYATNPVTKDEAWWTGPLPPTPVDLGVRSIRFTWTPPLDCLADLWSESPPAGELHWSQSCPRATLGGTTVCTVSSVEIPEHVSPTCEYTCTVPPDVDPLHLPVGVLFERIRVSNDAASPRPETLYSWHDDLKFNGQVLTSVVTPADRRLTVKFNNANDWIDNFGDELDALRVISGSSSSQLDLTRSTDKGPPPSWVSLPTPNRTCSDRIRIAVFGTRMYDEQTFEAVQSRIELQRPFKYRSRLHFYLLGGVGTIYRSFPINGTIFGELGAGMQLDLGNSFSLDLAELGFQVSRAFYSSIDLPGRAEAPLKTVPYLRIDARFGLEWWATRRFAFAALVGLGLSTPIYFVDDPKVGTMRWAVPVELQPLSLKIGHLKSRLIVAVGARLFAEHFDFMTDFLGDPTVRRTYDWEPYVAIRLRGLL